MSELDSRSVGASIASSMSIGTRVHLNLSNKAGTLAFVGETKFAQGVWYGVVLDDTGTGKNDGSIDGIKYFDCAPMSGVFVRKPALSQLVGGGEVKRTEAEEADVDDGRLQRVATKTRSISNNTRNNISSIISNSKLLQQGHLTSETTSKSTDRKKKSSLSSSLSSSTATSAAASSLLDDNGENFIVSRPTKGDKYVNLYSNEHRVTGSGGKFKHDNSPMFAFRHNIFKDAMLKARFRAEVYAVNTYLKQIETSKFREEQAVEGSAKVAPSAIVADLGNDNSADVESSSSDDSDSSSGGGEEEQDSKACNSGGGGVSGSRKGDKNVHATKVGDDTKNNSKEKKLKMKVVSRAGHYGGV